MTLTGESTTWPITNTIKPARYLMVVFKNLPDSQINNNNVFRVAMNQTQDPLIHKVQVRLNNDNYPNQPLTINPTTKDYNELYRNYENMCELFGNLPQFEYGDFALNHPIFCFDLSAHQEDLFKTGVNINIHIEKTQGDVTGYCLLLEEAKHLIKIADRRMIRIKKSALEYRPPIEPTPRIEPHHPKAIEYGSIIIRTVDDVKHYFSNPNPDLPKSILTIVDEAGLRFNGFSPNTPEFIIDTKDYIYTLTRGLIDLMNGGDAGIADYKDLVAYSKYLYAIRKTGPETNRSKEVDLYVTKVIEHDGETGDEYEDESDKIIHEIDSLLGNAGEGITFLSDNKEELLNRL
ncbi:hypothetical protein LOTGIDRAFT_162614 [Lottia gigantea]|uniref:Uncharacterized protein n=1 Tax=Lottia gigantea TaxID=225164 RepID=V4AFY0_LOTGI|nr:hypothetical protein LOTGIDRAFT_162614 [Lottia gigantea]ESO92311.1 hypothetical protein LOTGIDRAFT_162614 [Lottia gigantea]